MVQEGYEEIEEMYVDKEIHRAHTKWQLREEKYKEIILTSFCEISIIGLLKAIKEYQENKQDAMLQWMMFLDNPEDKEVDKIMKENEEIKEAKEEGRAEGKVEGKKEGLKEGEKKAKLEDAKKMLEEEITLEQVMRITGLTKEEIMEDMKK